MIEIIEKLRDEITQLKMEKIELKEKLKRLEELVCFYKQSIYQLDKELTVLRQIC